MTAKLIGAEDFDTTVLSAMLPEELQRVLAQLKKFKVLDIFKHISNGCLDFDNFTTLSLSERDYLKRNFHLTTAEIIEKKCDTDGTQKFSLQLFDKNIIETVLLLDDSKRKTACISSQVGCPLGCAFCKTGSLGFARNLYAAEIVEQFLLLEKHCGSLDNIVFMGMGEPLLNLDNVIQAIHVISDARGRNFSKRRITISTSGVISGIKSLAVSLPDIRLAVSLTAANPSLREKLMPVTKTNPLDKLQATLQEFARTTRRRITLEVALMHNINTDKQSCNELIQFARSFPCHINLIPWNKIPELAFSTPAEAEVHFVEQQLKMSGLNVTVRKKHGSDISGACGQLGKVIKG